MPPGDTEAGTEPGTESAPGLGVHVVIPRGPRALDAQHGPELSLVAPAHDEAQNLRPLVREIETALDGLRWELILVDDGSRDGTDRVIAQMAHTDDRVRAVYLMRRRGQTAALLAGIAATRAPLVATIDADLQNDPADLVRMRRALKEHDAVVGYRLRRRDGLLRRATSRFANGLRNRVTGDTVRDSGCGLKLFRASALASVPRFDGMHRFLPTLLRMHGHSVIELSVQHRPRAAGRSKYGVRNRAVRTLHDLLAVRWMQRRVIAPEEVGAPARRESLPC